MRVEPCRSGVPVGDTGRFSCPAREWRESREAMHQSGVTEMTDTHDEIANMDIAVDLEDARAYELARMRHSAAHLMAEAVLEIFPEARLGIGPAIEHGFYYDFDLPRPLTPDDLAEIERRMAANRAKAEPFVREVVTREEALRIFGDNPYKVELIEGLPQDEIITTYQQGEFLDLCRGPHVPSTAEIGPFKLLSIAGAYWRGDEKGPMLQRIYRTTGHLETYRENMYSPMSIEEVDYYLKPMNCPGHIMIYKNRVHSYRDLPIRLAELGTVYRYERSGTLHGMLRVRGFTQDDSHIFCTPEQVVDEAGGVIDLAMHMADVFGYEFQSYMATRPDKSIGDAEVWETATEDLRRAMEIRGLSYKIDEGGGAFYGPKIDIKWVDALNREWTGPTIQVDFNLPERFDVNYIAEDGERHRVAMIHRTLLGSMERFVGGLVEHYAGAFPLWLAPVQAVVIPITDGQGEYAHDVQRRLAARGIRAQVDDSRDRMQARIRNAQLQKVPYMLVIGKREVEAGSVSVRLRTGEDLKSMPIDDFIDMVLPIVETKSLDLQQPRPTKTIASPS